MQIVYFLLTLDLPYVQSLKGRRKIVSSIKERLKNRNISILDASGEYPKEAQIAGVFLATSKTDIQKKLQSIEKILERYFSDIHYTLSYDII